MPTPFGIGPDEDGITRTSVVLFSQDYLKRDRLGAWGLRSQFSFGTGLFDATTNNPPIPDGHFISWLGQFQRVQKLTDRQLLVIEADVQLTSNSLLASQQFVIGGGQSVRGYRQNIRSGDNGFRVSLENQITLRHRGEENEPSFQIIPFIDLGLVWNAEGNPNILPAQKFLIGIGLGLLWQPVDNLEMRFNYGYPFIDLEDRGNNIQDDGLYFEVNYRI